MLTQYQVTYPSKQPDFVITLSGQDITKWVVGWELIDDEAKMSCLSVEIGNENMMFSNFGNHGDKLDITFGYQGELIGKASLTILDITETYSSQGHHSLAVKYKAMDPTHEFASTRKKGVRKPNEKDFKEGLEAGLTDWEGKKTINVSSHGHAKSNTTSGQYNETTHSYVWRQAPGQKKSGSSKGGKSIGKSSKGGSHASTPVSGKVIKENKDGSWDGQRSSDNTANAIQNQTNAKLQIVGEPRLRGKTTITVTNVGERFSGKWYVKKVVHTWKTGAGLRSTADCCRGDEGKGGDDSMQAEQPMVMYADIWNNNELYIGPRKMTDSGLTFEYGTGGPINSFEAQTKLALNNAAAGGKSLGQIDLRKKGKADVEQENSEGSSSKGQETAPKSSGSGSGF